MNPGPRLKCDLEPGPTGKLELDPKADPWPDIDCPPWGERGAGQGWQEGRTHTCTHSLLSGTDPDLEGQGTVLF